MVPKLIVTCDFGAGVEEATIRPKPGIAPWLLRKWSPEASLAAIRCKDWSFGGQTPRGEPKYEAEGTVQEGNCPSGQGGPGFPRGLGTPPKIGRHGSIRLKAMVQNSLKDMAQISLFPKVSKTESESDFL